MKTAKEVLYDTIPKNEGILIPGQVKWIVEAMEKYAQLKGGPTEPLVTPKIAEIVKDEILSKMKERLEQFERQLNNNDGFANKPKINHKVKELKKCIQIVQSV